MNVMKLILSCSALILSVFSIIIDKANAQGSAGSMAMFPRMNIVDMPSARVIPVGSYRAYGLIMQSSGIVSSFTIAPAKNIRIVIKIEKTKTNLYEPELLSDFLFCAVSSLFCLLTK